MAGKIYPGIATHKLAGTLKVGTRRRTSLANPEIARKAAKAATTRATKGWASTGKPPIFSYEESSYLKEGVLNMASRLKATNTQMEELRKLDPAKLSQLYRDNKFVFEVFFDYRGITKENGALVTDNNRNSDIDFLLGEYNRAFSTGYTNVTLLDYD